MKKISFFFALIYLQSTFAQGFIIDHRDVALFESIPDRYLDAARNTGMMYSDRSVGANINEYLNYFTAESWAKSPAAARRDYSDSLWNTKLYTQSDWDAGLVPERIKFNPDPVKYSRRNWRFVGKTGSWSELTEDFVRVLAPLYLDSVKVLSFQFSYLNVLDQDDIADPQKGFFSRQANRYDVFDLQEFIDAHPEHQFFYWTSSLARGIGTGVSTAFNEQMRRYCVQHHQILFDMADIISHTDKGVPCFDNRDGKPYKTENYPDDGENYPAICQDYTSEVDGGHLGSVSGGGIRVVKALWVLMARMAGWDGIVASNYSKDADRLELAPNPGREMFYLRIPPDLQPATGQFFLISAEGIRIPIRTEKLNEIQFNFSLNQVPAGIYWIQWHNQFQRFSKKLILY